MDFERAMLALLPEMRAFARMLVRHRADADDLVQDTMLRMWRTRDRFEPGSNMRAWAFTILRRRFYSGLATRRQFEPLEDVATAAVATPALQDRVLEGREIRVALARLEPSLREVLALTAGSGMSVAEAAAVIGCPEGTVKSRAFRARKALRALLEGGADGAAIVADADLASAMESGIEPPCL